MGNVVNCGRYPFDCIYLLKNSPNLTSSMSKRIVIHFSNRIDASQDHIIPKNIYIPLMMKMHKIAKVIE